MSTTSGSGTEVIASRDWHLARLAIHRRKLALLGQVWGERLDALRRGHPNYRGKAFFEPQMHTDEHK